jgi:hypothetical protein
VGFGSQVIAFRRPNFSGVDWTREELAELYRIEQALIQARLTVDTERGVTDEGDPWFVFCRGDGEVLVHISRTDGEYFLHSPGLPRPLAGSSFSTLAKSFVNQIPVQLPLRSGRGAQLFIHPAAMLAVIIGTIFVASDDAHTFTPRIDGDSQSDNDPDSAPFGDRSLKASFQTAFQSYIDFFLGSLRDWNASHESAYLTLISTVAGFFLASVTAANLDQPQTASIAELVGGIDPSTTDAVAVTAFPNDTTANVGAGFKPAPTIAMGVNAAGDGETASANGAEQGHNDAVHLLLTSSFAKLDDAGLSKGAGEVVGAPSFLAPDEGNSSGQVKAAQDFTIAVLDVPKGVTIAASDVPKGSGAPLAIPNDPGTSTIAFDGFAPASAFDVLKTAIDEFVHVLKADFSSAVLELNDQRVSPTLSNLVALISNEETKSHPFSGDAGSISTASSGAAAITALPDTASMGNDISSSAPTVSPSTPTAPLNSGLLNNNDATIATTHPLDPNAAAIAAAQATFSFQLFDAAAATATINAFVKANPGAEFILVDKFTTVIYDGHDELNSVRPLTVQLWEAPNGEAIAIVGHADHADHGLAA